MFRILTILAKGSCGAAFALLGGLSDFSKLLQPLVVALSIMAAALLVRLNRGMPALDWKALEGFERKFLTEKVVELSRDYLIVLSLQFFTLVVLLAVSVKGECVPLTNQKYLLGAVGALLGLCVARMAYIVWRDFDIVRLQRKLIDDSADRDTVAKASEEALSKVAAIRASGVRPGPKIETSGWGD